MHQLAYWNFVVEFLREAKCRLPWFPLTDEEKSNYVHFREVVHGAYVRLPPESRTVVVNLFHVHQAGVLLPLMLALGRYSGTHSTRCY